MDKMKLSQEPIESSKESRIWAEAQEVLNQAKEAMLKKVGSIMPNTIGYNIDDIEKLRQSTYTLFARFQQDWFKDQVTQTVYEELNRDDFKTSVSLQVKHLVNTPSEQGFVFGIHYLASVIDEILNGIE